MVQKPKGREHHPSDRPWMKWVKIFSNRKDRQATKQKIHHEEYEDIPKDQPTKTEDPWGWD